MTPRARSLCTLTGVLVVGAAIAGVARAQGVTVGGQYLDGIRNAYQSAAGGWRARLVPLAQRTFMLLAALEFCVSGLVWTLKRDSLDDLAAKFLLKFLLILLSGLFGFPDSPEREKKTPFLVRIAKSKKSYESEKWRRCTLAYSTKSSKSTQDM